MEGKVVGTIDQITFVWPKKKGFLQLIDFEKFYSAIDIASQMKQLYIIITFLTARAFEYFI